jgi:hypothetical protein
MIKCDTPRKGTIGILHETTSALLAVLKLVEVADVTYGPPGGRLAFIMQLRPPARAGS